MKKLLHKSCQWLLMLIAMFAVSFSANAQDVTITPGYNASTMTSGDVTVSGTGSYMSGYGYLVQGNQNMVVTSSGKAIVKIVVTENSNYRSYNYWDVSVGELTSTVGSKDAPIWEGNAQSVTFSNKSNPQDWEMYGVSKVEVWFEGGSTGGEVDPGTGGETPDPGTGGGTVTPDPGTGTGAGGVLNFDFSAAGNGTLTQSPVTVTYSRSSEAGKSIASLSMFDNPLVFTSTGANIVKIEFTGKNLNLVNASLDGYNNPVWEGNAKSVSFTVNGGWSDFAAIYTAVVTLEGTAPDPGTDPEPGTDPDPDPEVTKPSFPAEGVVYQLQLVDDYATSYLNLQKDKTKAAILGAAAQGFTFTWDDENKGFVVKNTDDLYLGKPDAIVVSGIGSQTPDYWTVEKNGNSYYLKCSAGYLGFSSYSVGTAATRNNAAAEDAFIFTEYVAPDLTPFASIPASFIRESSIDMQVGDDIVSQLAFVFTASSDYGVDAFKLYPNGKSINLIVDGKSTSATLTCTQSGYCSISGMYPAISDEGDHNIVFPEGTFEAANGKVNAAFEYVYTILPAEAVQYAVNIYGPWSQSGAQPAPAGAYIVYKPAPETHYASGDSYVSENVPSAADFACGIPYWEIDEQHSIISEYGKSITIYLKRIPYTYDIVIEGCEQGAVTYYGTQYSATDDITTLEFIDEDEIEAVAVKGYNIVTTTINQPAEGKGGVIYVKYEEKPVVYATVDRTDPATGVYDLNDHLNGLSSLNVYLAKGDEFSQFGYYTSDGNMPEGINVTDAQGNVTNYTVGGIMSWNGYSFCIVNLANAIREAGIYTINIPAGALPLADEEKVSPEMHLTYEVKAATVFEIDNRDGVTAQGNRKDNGGLKTLTGFEITAPEGVTFDAIASDAKLYVQGEMDPETWTYGDPVEIEGVTFSFGTTKQTVLVNFSEPYAPEASESYTFILPAGTIVATDGRTNKEISLSAYVDPVEYFDLVVTYPVEGNAVAPVDHITVQLPEGLTVTNVDGYILFNGYQAEGYTYTQNDRELTINFGSEHAGEAGSTVSYYFGGSNITATDANSTVWKNNWKDANNIPVTAAPVEYLIEFAGWEITTHGPQVTYNGQSYTDQQHITAVDLTVEQLTATATEGYDYVITIDQPGYVASHGFGRVLVTYTAKAYAAVSRVSPAEGEISLDNAEGLGSITIFMDGEAGWDEDVYCGGGNPVPVGVSMVGPNGAIELPWEGGAYGFCMWAGSTQINVNFGGTLKTPGTYTLIIPAGLNTIGGKENPRMEYTWTVKEATTFEFDRYYVQAIGDRNNDGVQLSLTGFTVALPENLSDCSTEVPGRVDLYITVSTGDEMSEEPAEPTLVSSTYSITDGVVTFTFPEPYAEKGRVSVTLNANNIGINGLSNKAFSTSFYVDPNPTQYIELASATAETKYTAFNEITEYSVTSNDADWAGLAPDVVAEMFADKAITISYYTQEEGTVNLDASVESVSIDNGVVTFKFTEPVTIPFDTWYSVIFPAGFITFDVDNIQSSTARFNNHKLVESYVYDVVYDETVPEGASLLQNGITIPVSKESFGGPVQVESADFTATTVAGKQPVVTVVQPTREQPIGTVTLSYVTIEPVPFNGLYTINGTPSNLGEDFLSSISSFTIPAPEGHTFASADDCVLRIMRNLDTDYVTYESEATISEDGSEVTITLTPAYSTPAFNTSFVLDDNSLILDNGAPYVGFNCSVTLLPEYAFDIDHTDPADRAVIYNGELDHIDVYLPAGLNVGNNNGFDIEIVGTDYKESFQPSYISNFGDFYRIQLPTGMDLPYGRLTVTIPSDVFYYYDYENNNRYVTNAPYPLWIDNFSALQLVAEPAAGTVVGLDAIRVKGERGTLWNSDTNAETLAQSVHFSTYEGPVAVNTNLENGVLVITPVETLTEGYYTLTIDGFAGTLESADVAASVNAPARFEFNVVGSTFAFQGAQPYDGKTISELTELETINLSFGWNVGDVSVSEQAGNDPILVTLTDGDGTEQTVIQTYPAVSENEWGGSVAQLVGKVQGVDFASTADGKYNVSLTIPAGIFVSDNGRTNEAMTLHYVYDSNKYFAVSPNFESWGNVTGPVKTFTLTAAEGVTFTGIAPDKVEDPENGVDRPTVFKGGSYLTWANPVISADGKSVTLTLAEPISADSPYDQYYLVVPDGLFTGTVTTEEGVTFPATSTGFGAWQQAFYVTAPAYEYAQINWGDEMQSGDSYAGKASNFQIHFGKSVYCNSEVPAGAVLTDDQGTSYTLNSMWSSDDYLFLSSDEISAPGHYTLILPAGAGWFSESEYTQEVRFEFNIVGSFAITDGTFSPADNAKVDAPFVSFTYTLPEGKTVQSVDVTKIGTSELNNDTWQWEFTPFAGLTYEISGEKNQVVFTFAQPYTETGSVAIKVLDGAIVATDGSVSTTNPSPQSTFSVQVIKYTYNDITEDGVNDANDAIAISDIILQVKENDSKADVNGDEKVTIGDLVKYIQQLQSKKEEGAED